MILGGPLDSAPLSRLLWPLAIARQMRHDAEQALDDHQLSPVVNLMLLAADQHLEAAFVPRTGPSACYELDRPRFGELLNPIAPAFPAVAQRCYDHGFRKRVFFVGRKSGEELPEIKTFHRGALLLLVNVKIEQRHRSHVKKGFAHGTAIRRRAVIVLRFGYVLGACNRVLADDTHTVRELLRCVWIHCSPLLKRPRPASPIEALPTAWQYPLWSRPR